MKLKFLLFGAFISMIIISSFAFAQDEMNINEDIKRLYFTELSEQEQKELNEKKNIIRVTTQNVKTTNYVGGDVDLSNLAFHLTYDDYTKEKVRSDDERIRIDTIDTTSPGLKDIAVYMDRDGVTEYLCNYSVKISEKDSSEAIRSIPQNFPSDLPNMDELIDWFPMTGKSEYYLDEEVNVYGIIVKYYYEDESTGFFEVTEDNVESVDYQKVEGKSDINITLKNGMELGWYISWYDRAKALNRDNPLATNSISRVNSFDQDSIDNIEQIYSYEKADLPSRFRINELFDIKVANQGSFGFCNLFSFIKVVETNARLKYGYDYDLSERYADYMTSTKLYGTRKPGTFSPYQDGDAFGDEDDFSAGFVHGFALEEDIEYKDYSDMNVVKNADVYLKMNKCVYIDIDEDLDLEYKKELMKRHIIEYGGLKMSGFVCSGMHWYKNYAGSGHALCIVGWDDNYPKERFTDRNGNHPNENGAWIVLNSWGANWGDEGYLYVSYEHPLGPVIGVLNTEKVDGNLNYDSYCYTTKTKSVSLNSGRFYYTAYNINEGDYLKSIIIDEVPDPMKIYIVNDYDGTNINEYQYVGTASGVERLELKEPLKLEGDRFVVITEFFGNANSSCSCALPKNSSSHTYYSSYSNGLKNEINWTRFTYEMPIYIEKISEEEYEEPIVTSIEVVDSPNKMIYGLQDELDVTGGTIRVHYSNGSNEIKAMTDEDVFFYGFTAMSMQNETVPITVIYEGKSTTFNVTIRSVNRIEISKYPPLKHQDNSSSSNAFDGTILVYYSDGTSEEVSMKSGTFLCYINNAEVNPNNEIQWYTYELGVYNAKVELNGKTAEFEFEVVPSIESVRYISGQTKTVYYEGESFDFTGAQLEFTMSDGSTKMITSFDNLEEELGRLWVNWDRLYDGSLRVGDEFICFEELDMYEVDGVDLAQDMFTFTVVEAPGIKGDVDNNDEISIIDVRLLLQQFINATASTTYTRDELFFMDMDGNNRIDIIDVRLLLQTYINS